MDMSFKMVQLCRMNDRHQGQSKRQTIVQLLQEEVDYRRYRLIQRGAMIKDRGISDEDWAQVNCFMCEGEGLSGDFGFI